MKKTIFLRFFILVFLLFAIILLPLIKLPFFYLSYEFPKLMAFYAISIILFFLISLHNYYSRYLNLPEKNILIPIGFFTLIYLVSVAFSISPLTSLFGLREIYTGGLIYLFFLLIVSYSAFLVRKDKKIIIQSIVIVGFILSIYTIIDYLNHFVTTKELIYRRGANIGHPVKLAFYFLPIIFLNLSLFLEEKNKKTKLFFGITLISILSAFGLTFTRSSMFVFVAIFIIYLFLAKKQRKISNLTINKIIFTFISVIILFFLLITIKRIPFTQKDFLQSSLNLRLNEWQITLKDVTNRSVGRILFGNGPDTIYFTYNKYRAVPENQGQETIFDAPLQIRNHYLNLISSSGVIGLAAYLIMLIYILKNSVSNIGIFTALIAVLINSVFYYQTENILLLFWILTGLICQSTRQKKINLFYKSKKYLIFVLLVSLFFAIYFFRFLSAEILLHTENSLQTLKKSIKLNPYDDIYRYQLAAHYLDISREFKKQGDIEKAIINLNQAIEYGKQALYLSPLDRKNLFFIVQTAFWGGVNLDKNYHQQALPWIKKLIELDPQNYYVWDQLGQIYLDLGKLDEAMIYFNHAKILNPKMPGVYLHIGEVLKQKGKIKEAISQYEYVLKLYPNWDFALEQLNLAKQLLNEK